MFSPPKTRKRRHDEEGPFQFIFEIGSRKTLHPIPSTVSYFSETPESQGLQYYRLQSLNSETKDVVGSDRKSSSAKTMKISHSREPYTKRQCFTYFSRDSGDDKRESMGTEDLFKPKFGTEEMRDRGYICACHICRRKPSQKCETEFYSTCESCHKIVCYICLRQCIGRGIELNEGREGQAFNSNSIPNEHATATRLYTHYENICSHCCVELRTDGEVRCFGCLNQIL